MRENELDQSLAEQIKDHHRTVYQCVKELLETEPLTRGNDSLLVIRYLQRFRGIETMTALMSLAVKGGFSFETVRRTRQKIQSQYMHLLPDKVITNKRQSLEQIHREMAVE